MSLKQEIETWVAALAHYDNNEFDEALKSFDAISDTSKILFNCGVIHATLGEHEKAVDCYQRAVRLDQFLAVAYFQQGVSNFLMGDFEEALANFNDTLHYLRGNNCIDYDQLGLKFKLYSCEALFNRGLCYIYLQQNELGLQDLTYAAKEKVVPDHDVIDEAIREQAEGYTVFSIPVGIVYRPNEAKVKNLKTKDYLGKARLVAASDRSNAFTGFAGAERMKINELAAGAAKDDRPEEKISFAASNLVKPGITSRSRQQSEPPINRNVFPPTPPPESDRPAAKDNNAGGGMSRAQSVRGGGPKPPALELGRAAFDQSAQAEKPRIGTQRSASERPRPSRGNSISSSARSETGRRGGSNLRRVTSDEDEDGLSDDVYDMYNKPSSGSYSRRSKSQRPMYIEEEEEDDEDDYEHSDDAEFEMVSRAKSRRRPSPGRGMSRSRTFRTDVKTIRIKVHAEDTRYVMFDPNKDFQGLVKQIRDKFALRRDFKIKIRDDEDMITMADQDDLDMAIQSSKSNARREKSDMGKMEIWVQEL
ncbi:hypothetical protein M501DRAFT_985431 [Patellaria atrata CBS 101060]|uniref:PB1 domain-containing protein n=1 Tax=Patellaria atrata CBS 101060 TaxID=1346257 RepID=A0A9P4SIT5_9PEZI|nr:hypothetical protein M501DRAFT_985431 [Patellaria atrata CBS 101060]